MYYCIRNDPNHSNLIILELDLVMFGINWYYDHDQVKSGIRTSARTNVQYGPELLLGRAYE